MRITDLAVNNPWRADLQPAAFREAFFHVEATGIDNGRRTVVHEFPKKDVPYTEDMGRRAYEFSVRGYCISYPRDVNGSTLYRKDYRIARDILAAELSGGQQGPLYLPTYKTHNVIVICPRYRLTEEDRLGGYCVFDMTFQEVGVAPREPPPDPRSQVLQQFQSFEKRIIDVITAGPGSINV